MTEKSSQIDSLLPVLESVFQAKQVSLARIGRRIQNLKAQLKQLDRPFQSGLESAAVRSGADVRWEAWAQERRKLIMQELALAARDRENERVVVARALAKLEAARTLSARLSKEQKRLAEKRASW